MAAHWLAESRPTSTTYDHHRGGARLVVRGVARDLEPQRPERARRAVALVSAVQRGHCAGGCIPRHRLRANHECGRRSLGVRSRAGHGIWIGELVLLSARCPAVFKFLPVFCVWLRPALSDRHSRSPQIPRHQGGLGTLWHDPSEHGQCRVLVALGLRRWHRPHYLSER